MSFRAEGVGFSFGARPVLDNVSMTVEPGRLTAVVGPNGAGKSTLFKALTGELVPSSGRVTFEQKDIAGIGGRGLAGLRAVLPQSSQLSFPFTALEVVLLGLEARPGLAAAARHASALASLQAVDLAELEGRFYQQLSGGEQQRVHLARALCQVGMPMREGRPRYLFLDEPTSSLDIRHQLQALSLARDFARQGGGVLAILHDLNLAAAFADHIVVLHHGRVHSQGAPGDVINDDLLSSVFEVPLEVGRVPHAAPFILPHRLASECGPEHAMASLSQTIGVRGSG
jgi:iron complex transport system ATP-binding protein